MFDLLAKALREPAGPVAPYLKRIAEKESPQDYPGAVELANRLPPSMRLTRRQIVEVERELLMGRILPEKIAERLLSRSSDPHRLDFFLKPDIKVSDFLGHFVEEILQPEECANGPIGERESALVEKILLLRQLTDKKAHVTPLQAKLLRRKILSPENAYYIAEWVNDLDVPL